MPVSYTHLDVYKRQPLGETRLNCIKFSVPTKADLCEYYVNLEANTFDTFKVEPSLMTVFEQSHTWDELIQHLSLIHI